MNRRISRSGGPVRTALAIAAVSACALVPRIAHAGPVVDLGVGVMGGVGADILPGPDEKTVTVNQSSVEVNSFSGAMGGVGLFADFRVLGIVGVEADLFRSTDRGSGDYIVNTTKGDVSIGQPSLHIPLLAKVVLPLPLLRPYAVFGPEFVVPGTSSATASISGVNANAHADGYTMLTGGLGLEIKLPLPVIDIRIPLSLRFSANPGTSSKIADRVGVDLGGNPNYRSEWKYQALATVGAGIYF